MNGTEQDPDCLPAPSLHGSHNRLHLDGILIVLLESVLLFVRQNPMRQLGKCYLVVVVGMSRCCYLVGEVMAMGTGT